MMMANAALAKALKAWASKPDTVWWGDPPTSPTNEWGLKVTVPASLPGPPGPPRMLPGVQAGGKAGRLKGEKDVPGKKKKKPKYPNTPYNRTPDYKENAAWWEGQEKDDWAGTMGEEKAQRDVEESEKHYGDDPARSKKMTWAERFDRAMWRQDRIGEKGKSDWRKDPTKQPRKPSDVGWAMGLGSAAGVGRRPDPIRDFLVKAREQRRAPARSGGGKMRAV